MTVNKLFRSRTSQFPPWTSIHQISRGFAPEESTFLNTQTWHVINHIHEHVLFNKEDEMACV